jgi:hypothetical protein
MAFEKFILPSGTDPKMAIHPLMALVTEYIMGQMTKLEVLAQIEAHLSHKAGTTITLTADEKSDLQAWMTAVDGQTTTEEKMSVANDTYRVLIIAETGGMTTYDTAAKMKARLSWI